MIGDIGKINERAVKRLIERKLKISAAESCTGGLFTAFITDVAGSSGILEESIVTYSNEAKMRELGVKSETLASEGAVSAETARQMCEGICGHTGAEVGVGITGIAGPDGGTREKPVGTVFAGVCVKGVTEVFELHINGSREEVRKETCRIVFEKILERI